MYKVLLVVLVIIERILTMDNDTDKLTMAESLEVLRKQWEQSDKKERLGNGY